MFLHVLTFRCSQPEVALAFLGISKGLNPLIGVMMAEVQAQSICALQFSAQLISCLLFESFVIF